MTNETQKEVPIEVKKECDDHESELAVATISPQVCRQLFKTCCDFGYSI